MQFSDWENCDRRERPFASSNPFAARCHRRRGGLLGAVVVLAVYTHLVHKHLRAPFGDVRSGLFVAVAEWAARKVAGLVALDSGRENALA